MTQDDSLPGFLDSKFNPPRSTMNGKPVHEVPAKSVINFESGFSHKLLCDGPTFSTGSACAYSCAFCYVPDLMSRSPHKVEGRKHHEIVLRRRGAIEALRKQLVDRHGRPKFTDPNDRRVIYSSPLVDVAANMDLVRETIEACRTILALTNWHIRLLSKSNLLPKIAQGLLPPTNTREQVDAVFNRLIFGVSTGTLDDKLALSFEQGTPLPSKRIASLHWLQDNGFRTYGMICPSLPQTDYARWARDMHDAIRADRCEHVWAEVINVRGDSMKRTCAALAAGGYGSVADELARVSHDRSQWEEYARATFLAHAPLYTLSSRAHARDLASVRNNDAPSLAIEHPTKLRFLQYVNASNREWWTQRQSIGAILL